MGKKETKRNKVVKIILESRDPKDAEMLLNIVAKNFQQSEVTIRLTQPDKKYHDEVQEAEMEREPELEAKAMQTVSDALNKQAEKPVAKVKETTEQDTKAKLTVFVKRLARLGIVVSVKTLAKEAIGKLF